MELERGHIRVPQAKVLDPDKSKLKFYLSYNSALKQSSNHGLKRVHPFSFEYILVEGYICGKPQAHDTYLFFKMLLKGSGQNHAPLKPLENSSPTYDEMEYISFRVSKLEDMIKLNMKIDDLIKLENKMASKEDLKRMASKEDLKGMARKKIFKT